MLIEELALGRDFDFRNNRDADGPIFPIGDVDPHLPVHEDIVGIATASGKPVAFQRSKAYVAPKHGDDIRFENVRLTLDGSGIKAVSENGNDLGSQQASGSPGRSSITIQRFGRNRKNLHGAANPLALYRGTRGERCDEQCGTGTEHGTRQFRAYMAEEICALALNNRGPIHGRRRVRSIPPSSTPGITVSTFSRTSSVKKNSAT